MVELTNGSLKTAIREVLNEIPSITELKQEQESALVEFLGGKDVVAGFAARCCSHGYTRGAMTSACRPENCC